MFSTPGGWVGMSDVRIPGRDLTPTSPRTMEHFLPQCSSRKRTKNLHLTHKDAGQKRPGDHQTETTVVASIVGCWGSLFGGRVNERAVEWTR
jgi:hypothetical protein